MLVISLGHVGPIVEKCILLIILSNLRDAGDIPRTHVGPIVAECIVLILI